MTKLKPCPFCGSEAAFNRITELNPASRESETICVEVECQECGATQRGFDTEIEAIEVWNTRAERTCNVKPLPLSEFTEFECSKCCGTIRQLSNYCPHCGAKVVSE